MKHDILPVPLGYSASEPKGRKQTVFLFSGQGSHYYHMAKELYATNWTFRRWMTALDDIAMGYGSKSIVQELYYSNPASRSGPFNNLVITHPAIFIIQYSLAQTLIEEGIYPDYLFGSSLGEIVAACVAGCLTVDDAILLILRQAFFFAERAGGGGMIAVLASTDIYYSTPLLSDNACIAAKNYSNHFVLSGRSAAIAEIARYLTQQNLPHQVLDVTVAFHSKLIDSLGSDWRAEVDGLKLTEARIPLVSSSMGGIIRNLESNYFWECVRLPILFNDTGRWLMQTFKDLVFVDIGPSATSAGFLKNIDGASRHKIIPLLNMYGKDSQAYAAAVKKYNDVAFAKITNPGFTDKPSI